MHYSSSEKLSIETLRNGNLIESSVVDAPLDHPFLSWKPSITNYEFSLMVKNKDSSSIVGINNTLNHSNIPNFTCCPNEIISSESIMTSTKSKVPDILMINKYYGLIPQKFTISSRKTVNSTPSSAGSSSRRSSKASPATKPRAKSSTHHQNRQERKYHAEESKGCRSENDSPEPIKMFLVARNNSACGYESPVENFSDPFGPVTKKMSVERYKKWRNSGGGKGINMNMRSSSDIGQTLSLLDNGLPGGGFNSHAKSNGRVSSATEFTTNRRVIKIDLNRVSSWDEENYRITTTSSLDSSISRGENKVTDKKAVNSSVATHQSDLLMLESRNTSTASNNNSNSCSSCDVSSSSTCDNSRNSSQDKTSLLYSNSHLLDNNNGSYACFMNNDDCDSLVTDEGHQEQATFVSCSDTSGETNEGSSSSENMTTVRDSSTCNSLATSVEMPSSIRRESIFDEREDKGEDLLPKTHAAHDNDDNNGLGTNVTLSNNCLISSGEKAIKVFHDKKVASMHKFGRLSSRTISFDDKILDSSNTNGTPEAGVHNSNTSGKKRPTTASARLNSKTFSTPNGFNPPSKVIPWTQQKTEGGKALTLAERRAKFQRAPSIHSSSSLSMETGEEEAFSEVESNSHLCARPPSSAFRESRKPLHVTQPPEIPTMIAQINPNADEDIQIEIEKVALMLRKMQSMKNFSMSLDSGIEAEMTRASSAPEDFILSTMSKNAQSVSTNSVAMLPEKSKILNVSGSESSISSADSQSSDEEECPNQAGRKIKGTIPTVGRGSSDSSSAKAVKGREKPPGSGNLIKRQCSLNNNNSDVPNHTNNGTTNNNTKKMSPPPPLLQPSNNIANPSTTAAATGRTSASSIGSTGRAPLRKAVSISCEQELLKADGDRKRNEVNFNANDNGKSPRPKTASVTSSQYQRGNVSGTRSIHSNYQYRQNSISSSGESHHATLTAGASASSGSQGSRNRKILIKKALMEINQSSVNMRKKMGTLGRPRTAPSSDKCNNVPQHGGSQQHPRKPLKASPFPISANGKMGFSSSGKSASTGGGKTNGEVMDRESETMKSGSLGQMQRSTSEAPADDTTSNQQQQETGEKSGKGRSAFRQCFSLDESALLGFSIKSMNGGRIPIFEKLASAESTESCPSSIMDDEISFLSSKKREQCLKVYEKMMKTGCTIKLETIFRGMLTPSEYRAFMRAAEKANQEAEDEARNQTTGESLSEEVNASLETEDANDT